MVSVLLITDERFLNHRPGEYHPEQPDRLRAVWSGISEAGLADAIVCEPVQPATDIDLLRCHQPDHLKALASIDRRGGGRVDSDTEMSRGSLEAARLAAGAGITAIETLRSGVADIAFCAIRPPGHHARPSNAMGFCLFNNIAVAASALAEGGERVAIVDFDAHHGNGTQDVFYGDERVLFISCHQWPLYPGTGAPQEIGVGAGLGSTINLAFPPGAAGNTYRYAFDGVVGPAIQRFRPSWLLVSAGFAAPRAAPLSQLGLTAGDFADLTNRLVRLVSPGRSILFLEGGYVLDALASSVGSAIAAAIGIQYRPEKASGAGPGADVVTAAVNLHGLDS